MFSHHFYIFRSLIFSHCLFCLIFLFLSSFLSCFFLFFIFIFVNKFSLATSLVWACLLSTFLGVYIFLRFFPPTNISSFFYHLSHFDKCGFAISAKNMIWMGIRYIFSNQSKTSIRLDKISVTLFLHQKFWRKALILSACT